MTVVVGIGQVGGRRSAGVIVPQSRKDIRKGSSGFLVEVASGGPKVQQSVGGGGGGGGSRGHWLGGGGDVENEHRQDVRLECWTAVVREGAPQARQEVRVPMQSSQIFKV